LTGAAFSFARSVTARHDGVMKLLYTPIHGYVHTVEAVINYADLRDRIEPVAIKPFGDSATQLTAVNPLGKVPTLQLDSGEYLAGGPVIYEYLDSLHKRRRLYPTRAPRRWRTLRQCWMADGLFDTFVLIIIESWEPAAQQRQAYVARCWGKVESILNQLERDAATFERTDIAQLRAVGALQFLELKLAQIRESVPSLATVEGPTIGRPALAGWFARAARDPIFHRPLVSLE